MFHRLDACLANNRADRQERARLAEAHAREQAALASWDAYEASENAQRALERCVRAYDEDIAAFVAHRLLQANEACPVCGSCEHPAPARAGADTDGADFELSEARARRDAAVAHEKEALRKLAAAEARLAAALARHASARETAVKASDSA